MDGSIAIISARGGSRRIPRKNIRPFMGRPMIHWTIDAALESGCFEHVLVSTDDDEIRYVSRAGGAEVPFLRVENADDHATVSQAVYSAILQSEKYWEKRFRVVTQLMPNCPLRTANDIQRAMTHFHDHPNKFQISTFRFGWMNPWWALQKNPDGTAEQLFPEAVASRSQDLPPLYCPTGAIWIAECEAFRKAQTFYGPDFSLFELPWESAVDIDEPADLRMAEAVATIRYRPGDRGQ